MFERTMIEVTIFTIDEDRIMRSLGKISVPDTDDERQYLSATPTEIPTDPGSYIAVRTPFEQFKSSLSFHRVG